MLTNNFTFSIYRTYKRIYVGFESLLLRQKIQVFGLGFFYPLRKQWYIIRPLGLYIITRQRVSKNFRNDDIQDYVLMICNFLRN